ncbi:MAG: hypothetical protein RRA35_09940 [Desulfomonilia bacterium]|nr:hypothetical protein [Desulfomonilia bacterium]
MDFRDTQCTWCGLRKQPLEDCRGCPKYDKYVLKKDIVLNSEAFCSICIHENDPELSVYCSRNRYYQQDGDEPFDCYRFCPLCGRGR